MAQSLVDKSLSVLYFSISVFLGTLGLKSLRRYHLGLLFLLAYLTLHAFGGIIELFSSIVDPDVMGLFLLLWPVHMSCILCVEKNVLSSDRNLDWRTAYKMIFNFRWLNTYKQAPDVRDRRQSSHMDQDNKSLSFKSREGRQINRKQFLFTRCFSALTLYTLNQLYMQVLVGQYPKYYSELSMADLVPSKQIYIRRLTNVTARESAIRCLVVFDFVWTNWASLTRIHDILAVFFVGIGIDQPEDWPPLYGSLSEAFTLRRFWGKFWHRLVYKIYTAYATRFSRNVLRLNSDGISGRLVVNFVVFFLSGAAHALVLRRVGFSCGYWEDLGWYCLNFGGILAETVCQGLCWRLIGVDARRSKTWEVVGFIWVFGFFFWSLPKSQFPKMRCFPEEH